MHIDITKLLNRLEREIRINDEVIFPKELLENTRIYELINTKFDGVITFDYDEELLLKGTLSGLMILEDDLTLEKIKREFSLDILENMQNYEQNQQNSIDIMPILWQNIVVEVPMRVTNSEIKDIKVQGDGWKVIAEDELEEKGNLSLGELLEDVRKEWYYGSTI